MHTFEAADGSQYQESSRRYMHFADGPPDTAKPARPCAAHVKRHATLDPSTGVTKIDIELTDLVVSHPIVLAKIDRRMVSLPAKALANGQEFDIELRQVNNTVEYRFPGWPSDQASGTLSWSYRVANPFALTRAERGYADPDSRVVPNLPADYESWTHLVQFDYDKLTLIFEADDGYFAEPGGTPTIEPVVLRPKPGHHPPWERVEREESRARSARPSPSSCAFSWPSPMAGYSYGFIFRLAREGASLPPDIATEITHLATKCRSNTTQGGPIREELTERYQAAIRAALGLSDTDDLFADHSVGVVNLWNHEERLLRPCFGQFPPDAWVTNFRAGQGIAGHAFRFGRPAAWHHAFAGDFDVIRVPTMTGTRDYEWILALPILTEPTLSGKTVGVFGFAGTKDHDSRATERLAQFARAIAQHKDPHHEFVDLWYLINAAFWLGIRDLDKLVSLNLRELAEASFSAYQMPARVEEDAHPGDGER
ncbi:MAG TPA: GAF domain-containing protein, partial [Kofleriaceae bacterium]|nr:GAF domain-containing protein [Kofleriaceae bacterium]